MNLNNFRESLIKLFLDKLMSCEMIVLNRTPDTIDKDEVHKIVRGISRRATITYDYPDGHVEYDEIEDPLPYDINADVIEIADVDFAIFYRDMTEDFSKYNGKTVKFKGVVARDMKLGKDAIVIGRHVMTCCVDDITFAGFFWFCSGSPQSMNQKHCFKASSKCSGGISPNEG